jgi:hypothetical protein
MPSALNLDSPGPAKLVPVQCVNARAGSALNGDGPAIDCSANDLIDALQETEP